MRIQELTYVPACFGKIVGSWISKKEMMIAGIVLSILGGCSCLWLDEGLD